MIASGSINGKAATAMTAVKLLRLKTNMDLKDFDFK